jgi:predicted O-methyltransferase YrrM
MAENQEEILDTIVSELDIDGDLPDLSTWVLQPDALSAALDEFQRSDPELILELGSGLSSIIFGYYMRRRGSGQVVSLEHEEEYLETSREYIRSHDLESVVDVRHAPLAHISIDESRWIWYDLESLEGIQEIDFVLIDGPPGRIQPLARFPALPVLYPFLSPSAVLYLDDAGRKAEQQTMQQWQQLVGDQFTFEGVDTEKGGAFIRRTQ